MSPLTTIEGKGKAKPAMIGCLLILTFTSARSFCLQDVGLASYSPHRCSFWQTFTSVFSGVLNSNTGNGAAVYATRIC